MEREVGVRKWVRGWWTSKFIYSTMIVQAPILTRSDSEFSSFALFKTPGTRFSIYLDLKISHQAVTNSPPPSAC
jgi:hypothetical protein